MQKLIFRNGNGVEVDFTSGDFGIVNWTGFSESDLNIQTQQVPFNDGSVYLDSLIQDRVINITLAINDEKNLEKRYTLRREIIALMNPKLGIGELIYENDIFKRKISCLPKLPTFPTKNFNDSGTVKASLSFHCPSPYWEDVEETVEFFEFGKKVEIENVGDIESQIKIDLFTTNVENPEIVNETTDEKIKLIGEFSNNINIDTNVGSKNITLGNQKLKYWNHPAFSKILYVDKFEKIFGIYQNFIYSSNDGLNWDIIYSGTGDESIQTINYFNEMNVLVCVGDSLGKGLILKSTDGINWERFLIENEDPTEINQFYFENIFYIGDSFKIYATDSSISSMKIYETEDFNSVTEFCVIPDIIFVHDSLYVNEIDKLILVGRNPQSTTKGKIISTSDFINWDEFNAPDNSGRFTSICYSQELNKILAVTNYLNGEIPYSKYYVQSTDGVNWELKTFIINSNEYSIDCNKIIYTEDFHKFIVLGKSSDSGLISSYDGTNWEKPNLNISDNFISIDYIKSVNNFIAMSDKKSIISYDSNNWKELNDKIGVICNSSVYSEKLRIFVAISEKKILKSNDGINWDVVLEVTGSIKNYSVAYSEKLNKFIVVGTTYFYTSSDGVNWEYYRPFTYSYEFFEIKYFEDSELFIAVGTRSSGALIVKSTDGINWERCSTNFDTTSDKNVKSVIYSKKLNKFIAICNEGWGSRKLYSGESTDGVNWYFSETGISSVESVKSISYSDKLNLFIAVGTRNYEPLIAKSTDGVNWVRDNVGSRYLFFKTASLNYITWSSKFECFICVGDSLIVESKDGINWNHLENLVGNFNFVIISPEKEYHLFGLQNGLTYNEKYTNIIDKLSEDSNMNLNLKIGLNRFRIMQKSGSCLGRITYTNKYLGV